MPASAPISRLVAMLACALLLGACTPARDPAPPPACSLSAADEDWIARSVAAWRFAAREIGAFSPPRDMEAVFFDDDCVWSSRNAMGGDGPPEWSIRSHAGSVVLPGGEELPAGVTSFATAVEGRAFFVMSTPSTWETGGVPGGPLGLPTLMSGVLIHEASHVTQVLTYGRRIGALEDAHDLPDDFNDDSMQRRFEGDEAFAASIARESDLLLRAAESTDAAEMRRLAREARALMQARAERYFVGEDAFWREAEDVWLTFEGSAQWLSYQWLVHPRGAGVAVPEAMPGFALRSRWWSQKQGFALFLLIDRLTEGAWRAIVFGDGSRTALQVLDEALAEAAMPPGQSQPATPLPARGD